MKKLTFYLLLIFITTFISCYKCSDSELDYCKVPPTGEKYFKGYANGSYWIYENQDYSKKDSVYVMDYQKTTKKINKDGCFKWDEISFELHSQYLFSDIANGIYNSIDENRNAGCGNSIFSISDINSGFRFFSKNGNSELSCLDENCIKLSFYKLRDDPLLTFYEAMVYESKYWISPEVGLIQYISFNNLDTFYISKYHIE